MKRQQLPLLLIFALMFFPAPAFAEATLADVEAALKKLDAFTARFEQTFESKGFGVTSSHAGSVALQKPGMMRWDYDKPKGKQVVADGEKLWIYDPDENIVLHGPLAGYITRNSPAFFLAGEATLNDLFKVTLIQPKNEDIIEGVRIRLVPQKAQPGVKAMLLTLDGATLLPRELLMVDFLGAKNRIRFIDVTAVEKRNPDYFRFRVPHGVPIRKLAQP